MNEQKNIHSYFANQEDDLNEKGYRVYRKCPQAGNL